MVVAMILATGAQADDVAQCNLASSKVDGILARISDPYGDDSKLPSSFWRKTALTMKRLQKYCTLSEKDNKEIGIMYDRATEGYEAAKMREFLIELEEAV